MGEPGQSNLRGRRYHIVGIRVDGSHAVVGRNLTLSEARRVRDALASAHIFTALKITPDSDNGNSARKHA